MSEVDKWPWTLVEAYARAKSPGRSTELSYKQTLFLWKDAVIDGGKSVKAWC